MFRIRKSDIAVLGVTLAMAFSVLSTIIIDSLFSKLNLYVVIAVSAYITVRLFQRIIRPKSVVSIIAIIFAWWCFWATVIVNGPNIYIWGQVILWPELLALTEIENYGTCYLQTSEKLFRKIEYFMLVFSVIICFLFRFLGVEMRTNYIYQTYNLICFLPMIYVIEQNNPKRMRNITFAVLLINIIFAKRGGIIASVLGVCAYYATTIIMDRLSVANIKKTVKYLVIAVILVALALYVGEKLNLEIFQRMQDMSMDTGSSGRDTIWDILLTKYFASNPQTKLFGFGFNGTYTIETITDAVGVRRGTAAHNDYIGILFNYGYVALGLLVVLICYLLVYFIRMIKERYYLAPAFAMSLVIFALFSWVSICAVSSEISCWLAVFWGISISEFRKYMRQEEVE